MAVLELLLQANRLNEDAERAKRALEGIKTSATGAETAVSGAGRSMSAAFQTAGGAVQLAGGVQQVASAFQSANLAAASLGGARFLVELSQTTRDFGNLRAAVGGTGGVFATLGTIIKANPLLTLATVLTGVGGVVSAMGLFRSATKEAGEQIDIAKRKADEFRSSLSGIASAAASGQSLAGSVRQFLAQGDAGRRLQDVNFRQLFSLEPTAGSLFDDPDTLGEFTSLSSLKPLFPLIESDVADNLLSTRRGRFSATGGDEVVVSRREFERFLREQLRVGAFDRGTATDLSPAATIAAAGRGVRQGGTTDDEFLAQGRSAYNADQSEQAAARMREMVESARQVGAYLGDAFFDALTGARSVRNVLAGIVSDFARQGLRNVVSSIAGSIAGGFGQTAAQTRTVGGE